MPIEVEIFNLADVIAEQMRAAANDAEAKAGEAMAQTMRDKITSDSHSGAIYGGHQASAPGEAPADWHHGLLESIHSAPEGGQTVVSVGGESAPYEAAFLEYGSPNGKIAARPLVTPTAEEYKPIVVDIVTQAIQDALK